MSTEDVPVAIENSESFSIYLHPDDIFIPQDPLSDRTSDFQGEHSETIGKKKRRRHGIKKKELMKECKLRRNAGKDYVSISSGKFIAERVSKELVECRLKCKEKISDDNRKSLFDQYWSLGEYCARAEYMNKNTHVVQKKRQRKNITYPKRERNFVFKYTVEIDNEKLFICRDCFLRIHGETESFLRTIQKKTVNKIPLADQRGGSNTESRKITPELEAAVRSHIHSFPAYIEDMNLTKMYELYKNSVFRPVSIKKYREIFQTLNLKFRSTKPNTCTKCGKFNVRKTASTQTSNENLQIENNFPDYKLEWL